MASLIARLWGHRAQAPLRDPTDEIVPVHICDDADTTRPFHFSTTLRFNDVLDLDLLEAAFSRLLEIGDWRRLGGRFRLNSASRLELHIPQRFTPERPAVVFTRSHFDCPIDQHPLASRLPQPAPEQATVHVAPEEFDLFARSEKTPRCLNDYLSSDAPQFSVHAVSFENATLVSLGWAHITADSVGIGEVCNAWSLVLAGRESEVPPMLSLQYDLMELVAVRPGEEIKSQHRHPMADKEAKGFVMFLFVIRFILDMIFYSNMSSRTLFIPRTKFQRLRNMAVTELDSDPVDANGRPVIRDWHSGKPFLSNGDWITAFFTRMAALSLPGRSKRTICVMNVLNIRNRAPSALAPSQRDGTFVQNAAIISNTLLPAAHVNPSLSTGASLAKIAASLRADLVEQSREDTLRGTARLHLDGLRKSGRPPLFVDGSSFLVKLSNWTVARFLEIDFSPAVVANKGTEKAKRPTKGRSGRPVYQHTEPLSNFRAFTYAANITETPDGDIWVHGYLPSKTWAEIEQIVKAW